MSHKPHHQSRHAYEGGWPFGSRGMPIMRAVVSLAALIAQSALGACFTYGPTVAISGKLEQRTFPGLPNYEDVRKGDQPEKGFYLSLSTPVCTSGDASAAVTHP